MDNPDKPLEIPEPENAGAQSNHLSLEALRYGKTAAPDLMSNPEVQSTLPESGIASTNLPNSELSNHPVETLEEEMNEIGEPKWRRILKAILVFSVTFVVTFLLLQSPALIQRASYSLFGKNNTTDQALAYLPKLQDRPVLLSDIKNRPEDYLNPNIEVGGLKITDMGDNYLLIPKINVNAPIVWNSPSDEAIMLANLQNGVVHYDFTALPNEGKGNVFLTGHSSYFIWDPGKYKTIFANLDRMQAGDQIALTYQGVVYIYEIFENVVVKPDQTWVLDQGQTEQILSLMTCVPVGTNLNRLVVRSKLISATSSQPVPLAPPDMTEPSSIFHYLIPSI